MSVAEPVIPESLAECRVTAQEWELRGRLASAYHVVEHLGWTESIYGHITLKVPGPERHFLINPYGLRYDEVTAENLVKIDLDGQPVGPPTHPVNVAGYVIHSAVHAARPDLACVFHTHTTAGMAVAARPTACCRSASMPADSTNASATTTMKDPASTATKRPGWSSHWVSTRC